MEHKEMDKKYFTAEYLHNYYCHAHEAATTTNKMFNHLLGSIKKEIKEERSEQNHERTKS